MCQVGRPIPPRPIAAGEPLLTMRSIDSLTALGKTKAALFFSQKTEEIIVFQEVTLSSKIGTSFDGMSNPTMAWAIFCPPSVWAVLIFVCQALRNLSVKSGRGSLPSSVVNPDPEFRIQGYALNLEREKFKRLEGNKFLFKEILFFYNNWMKIMAPKDFLFSWVSEWEFLSWILHFLNPIFFLKKDPIWIRIHNTAAKYFWRLFWS